MLYRANNPLIVKGDAYKRGQEVELSTEEAQQFDPADLTAVDAIPEEKPAEPEPEVPLDEMNLEQLKAKADELGLSKSGSKADILERINLHLSTTEEDEDE